MKLAQSNRMQANRRSFTLEQFPRISSSAWLAGCHLPSGLRFSGRWPRSKCHHLSNLITLLGAGAGLGQVACPSRVPCLFLGYCLCLQLAHAFNLAWLLKLTQINASKVGRFCSRRQTWRREVYGG